MASFYINMLLRRYRKTLLTQGEGAGRVTLASLKLLGASVPAANLESWCSRQLAPGVLGLINQLVLGPDNIMVVFGWIFAFDLRIKELNLFLGPKYQAKATLGQSRIDIRDAFPAEPYAWRSGFSACIPSSAHQVGSKASIVFEAKLSDESKLSGKFPVIGVASESEHPAGLLSVNFA